MPNSYTSYSCCRCDHAIAFSDYSSSMGKSQLPLCSKCQTSWYDRLLVKPTPYTKKLFLKLKWKGFVVNIEEFDGHKTVDIVAKDAMVHIEVDGSQHNIEGDRAIRDLWRTLYSIQEGYYTLRIPNSAIYTDLDQTVRVISDILEENKKRRNLITQKPEHSFQERLIRAFVRNFQALG